MPCRGVRERTHPQVEDVRDAVQSPGQNIHGYLAVLRSLARLCNLTVTCSCRLAVDYSDSVIKDQLIRGMSDDMDRQRLLAEPQSEDMTLEQVVMFLHRLETSHFPIQGTGSGQATSGVTTPGSSPAGNCWRCGKPNHPDNSPKTREKHCPAYSVTCDKCKQLGHFKRCCPKCSDCDTWGHRSKSYRGCGKHERKALKGEKRSDTKDETGSMVLLCNVSSPGPIR